MATKTRRLLDVLDPLLPRIMDGYVLGALMQANRELRDTLDDVSTHLWRTLCCSQLLADHAIFATRNARHVFACAVGATSCSLCDASFRTPPGNRCVCLIHRLAVLEQKLKFTVADLRTHSSTRHHRHRPTIVLTVSLTSVFALTLDPIKRRKSVGQLCRLGTFLHGKTGPVPARLKQF